MTVDELADELLEFYHDPDGLPYLIAEASEKISQQAKYIAQLECENEFLKDWRDTWTPHINSLKRKPLNNDEIDKLADEYLSDYFNMQETINFVKAIEERHGIK